MITNAVLLPKMQEDFWKTCRQNEIVIKPTKYPIHIDFDAIEAKAEQEHVKFQYFNNGQAEMTLGKQPIDIEGRQPAEDNFYHCYRANNCVAFSHGKLYSCLIPAHLHHFKDYFQLPLSSCENDGIDIYSVNNTEEILKMLEKPLEACKYCDRSRVLRSGFP